MSYFFCCPMIHSNCYYNSSWFKLSKLLSMFMKLALVCIMLAACSSSEICKHLYNTLNISNVSVFFVTSPNVCYKPSSSPPTMNYQRCPHWHRHPLLRALAHWSVHTVSVTNVPRQLLRQATYPLLFLLFTCMPPTVPFLVAI